MPALVLITPSGWITLAVLLAAIVVFVGGWLAPDIVALITLLGMFVLSEGLLHSGALDRLRELLGSPRIRSPQRLVAILLPVIEGWCRRRGVSPSKVLIPLSIATITGGTLTLIGTSTNLLASDVSAKLGYGEFQLFSFTAIGLPVWLIGSLYLNLAARFLPDRGHVGGTTLTELTLQGYLTEVVLPSRSPLCERTLHASRLLQDQMVPLAGSCPPLPPALHLYGAGREARQHPPAAPLCSGVRRQPDLPLADRLSDQPDGLFPGELPLP